MKIVKIVLILSMLFGCSHQSNEENDTSEITTTTPLATTAVATTPPVFTTTTTIPVPEDKYPNPEYHDELMAGDFSSIAGEYESPEGKSVVINDKGLREGKVSPCSANDIYAREE